MVYSKSNTLNLKSLTAQCIGFLCVLVIHLTSEAK